MLNGLLQMVGVALLVGIVAAAVCRLGRPRPAFCHALWLLVVVKLLMPPVVAWPWQPDATFGAQLVERLAADKPLAPTAPPAGETVPAANPAIKPEAGGRVAGRTDKQVSQAASVAAPAAIQRRRPVWPLLAQIGLTVWAAGALFAVALHLRRILKFRRAFLASEPAPEWLKEKVGGLARVYGVHPPEVRVAHGAWSPMLYGVRRPILLAPRGALDEVEPERWETVVAHELAHLRRRDHLVAWVVLAASCVWWWNPVLWWARSQIGRYAEMACDAWVLWALPDRGREYADTLIQFVQRHSERPPAVPEPVPCMSAHGAGVFERRLTAILRGPAPYRLGSAGAACLVAIAAVVLPVFSREEATEPVAGRPVAPMLVSAGAPEQTPQLNEPLVVGETSPALVEALRANVTLDIIDFHISDIAKFIGETYSINIVIDWRAVKPRELRPHRDWAVGKAEAPEEQPPPPPPPPMFQPIAGHVYATDGMVPYLKLSGVPVGDALNATVSGLGLTYVIYPHVLFITSPGLAAADMAGNPPYAGTQGVLREALKALVTVDFKGAHVQKIAEFMSEAYGVNIVLDWRFVAKHGQHPSDALQTVASSGFVPWFSVTSIPLGEALDVLLRSINLTYYPKEDFIWISAFALDESQG